MKAANDAKDRPQLYRSLSANVTIWVALIIAVLLLADIVIHGYWLNLFLLTPWILTMLWALYVISYASCVKTDERGIRVQNLLRITEVPWVQISEIKMNYQLVLELENGSSLRCVGGPTAGRPGMLSREELRRQEAAVANHDKSEAGRGSARLSTGLKQLAQIRNQWQHYLDQHHPGAISTTPIQRSWDKPALFFAAGLLVWLLVSIFLALANVS